MPKNVDHEERRAELAEAVWRVITKRGMRHVTVHELAAASGWSRGVLDHYFSNKDSLLLFAFQLATDRSMARIARQRAKLSGMQALRAVALETLDLDLARKTETKVWTSFLGQATSSPELAEEHRRRYGEWRRILEDLIAEAVQAGELPTDTDPPSEAESLMAFLDGLSIQAMFEPARFGREHLLSLLDTYMGRLVLQSAAPSPIIRSEESRGT